MAATSDSPIKPGTRLKEYKAEEPELKLQHQRVRAIMSKIERGRRLLQIKERAGEVERGREYWTGRKKTKGQKVYVNYLFPLLEEQFRKTLPAIPTPTILARDERAQQYEARARQLLDVAFTSDWSLTRHRVKKLQWDDAEWGIGIGKTVWRVDAIPAEHAPNLSEEQQAPEIARATEENQNPLMAQITEADADDIHISVHVQALEVFAPGSEEALALQAHIDDHGLRMMVIVREWCELKRIPPDKFVWDTDVPWSERTWEAEQYSVRVADLLKMGCVNISEENLPREIKPEEGQGEVPFEDMTACVWDYHDRLANQRKLIPAQSTSGGEGEHLFLLEEDWLYGDIDIYVPLVFRDGPEEAAYGISTVEQCVPIIEHLADVDYSILKHVKEHASYKVGIPFGVNPKVKSQLKDPNGRFFEIPPEMIAAGKLFEFAPPAIPPALLEFRDLLISDLRWVTSTNPQDVGASNPHQISATESARRGVAHDERRADRQEIMGQFLARVAKNYLLLFKRFASQAVTVRIIGQMGIDFQAIDPTTIPQDIDVVVDVRGETDETRTEQATGLMQYVDMALKLGVPLDWQAILEAFGRRVSLPRPERFRAPLPQMPPQESLGQAPTAEGGGGGGNPKGGGNVVPFSEQGGAPDFAPSSQALLGTNTA